ncbi:MAG TPA: hypothetical protein VD866_01530 [Urbifossiella sp.]|nr:hypothetical protein [Urbifossiella sp.]
MKWLRSACASTPRHRVRVERKRGGGMAAAFELAMSGRRWTYWCTCDGEPHTHLTQPQALAAGLTHLGVTHGQRTAR